ncbi:MAG TPA: hypothetical protein PLZ51_28020, partial [Aggregatilineales bacterium]|nr:hypothetical protein [Aggregatilineales bacterium]
ENVIVQAILNPPAEIAPAQEQVVDAETTATCSADADYNLLVTTAYNEEDYETALPYARCWVELAPDDYDALIALADSLWGAGEYEESIGYYTRTL